VGRTGGHLRCRTRAAGRAPSRPGLLAGDRIGCPDGVVGAVRLSDAAGGRWRSVVEGATGNIFVETGIPRGRRALLHRSATINVRRNCASGPPPRGRARACTCGARARGVRSAGVRRFVGGSLGRFSWRYAERVNGS
jgi:hypothetical protein